ncbi:MAG TPA: A24 family peptidase [Kiloniellales bacterium]|nr:A24 family peptidase [Kiloniellales bacterium]
MALLAEYHWLALLLVAPFVGSFLGLLIVRLPAGRPVVTGRSACEACGRVLGPAELVPVASWLMRRGRCAACGARLHWAYPAVEVAALGIAAWSLAVVPGWLAWPSAALGWALLVLAAIDARHLTLPDAVSLPLIAGGLILAGALDPARLPEHLIGAALGFLLVVGLRRVWLRLRGREAIGLGDARLLAAAGAWLGWAGLPSVILLAAGAGLLAWLALLPAARRRGEDAWAAAARELPFGPFLAGAFWLVWLYGPLIPA